MQDVHVGIGSGLIAGMAGRRDKAQTPTCPRIAGSTFFSRAMHLLLDALRKDFSPWSRPSRQPIDLRRPRRDSLEFLADRPAPLHELVVRLQPKEEALRHAEISGEAEVGVGSDRPLAQHDLVDAPRRYVDSPGQRSSATAPWAAETPHSYFAGVWVGQSVSGNRRFRLRGHCPPPTEANPPLIVDADRISLVEPRSSNCGPSPSFRNPTVNRDRRRRPLAG